MKITVSTFYDPTFLPLAEKTIPNHDAYCFKHGYIYKRLELQNPVKGNGYEKLCKFGLVKAKFDLDTLTKMADGDYLFTLGVDAIITDMDKKLETLIEEYKDFLIVVGSDRAGINSSQQLIRNCPTARKYYLKMVAWILEGGEHDQAYLHSHPENFMIETNQKCMNSYDCETRLEPPGTPGDWSEGDFLVHLAGMTLEQRMGVVNKWLGRVK
ncbi:MAG: hypothetical protein KGL39_31915 [Patescibacteria group bacterium]|nr:hypothetical protein [Patescibacteria group bacterium]